MTQSTAPAGRLLLVCLPLGFLLAYQCVLSLLGWIAMAVLLQILHAHPLF